MQPADCEEVGERLGVRSEKCVRRKKHLRDPSGKRCPPPFMRGISVLHFFTVMTLYDIVVKPLLIMLLLPGPLLPVM